MHCSDVGTFLNNFKKGSKQIRKVMELHRTAKMKTTEIRSVTTYYRLVNLVVENEEKINSQTNGGILKPYLILSESSFLNLKTTVSQSTLESQTF